MKNIFFTTLCAVLLVVLQRETAEAENSTSSSSHTSSSCTTTSAGSSTPTVTSSSIATASIIDSSQANLNYSPVSISKKKKSKKKTNSPLASINQMLRMGDYVRADAALQKFRTTHPHIQADKYNLMGIVAQESGDIQASLEYFDTALSVRPRHVQALYQQAMIYLDIGYAEKAKDNLSKLNDICWLGCNEKTELKIALEAADR